MHDQVQRTHGYSTAPRKFEKCRSEMATSSVLNATAFAAECYEVIQEN